MILDLLNQWWENLPKSILKGGCHPLPLSYAQWSEYSPTLQGPTKTHCDTWPKVGRQHLPSLGAKNLTHSNPVHQIAFQCCCRQSVLGHKDPGLIFRSCDWTSTGDLGNEVAKTALATGVFFQRVCG